MICFRSFGFLSANFEVSNETKSFMLDGRQQSYIAQLAGLRLTLLSQELQTIAVRRDFPIIQGPLLTRIFSPFVRTT